MTMAEEKLDLLVNEVKALQEGQLEIATTVKGLHTWSFDADRFSVGLSKEIASLTSHEGVGSRNYFAQGPTA
jgi:hypothetical protein